MTYGLPESSWRKVDEVLDAGLVALQLAARTGVKMAYGTDLLGGMHRHQNHEFRIRSEVQGAVDVIRSATVVGAELVGMTGEIGTLDVGAYADLLVLDGNPLENIGVLADPANIRTVIQGGTVVRG